MHASAAVCQCTAGTTGVCRRLRRHRHCPHSLSRADRRLPHGLGAKRLRRSSGVARSKPENLAVVTGFGNCDFLFDVGSRYLVFAKSTRRSRDGLESSICLPTSPFNFAAQSLADLGPGRALEAYCTSATESLSARYRRVAHSSFLWGVSTSASLFNGPVPSRSLLQVRFLLAPLVGLSTLVAAAALAFRRRFRVLAFAAPLLLLAAVLSLALQGYIAIRSDPLLSYSILRPFHGA